MTKIDGWNPHLIEQLRQGYLPEEIPSEWGASFGEKSPIEYLIESHQEEAIQTLVDGGASLGSPFHYGMALVHLLAERGLEGSLEKVLHLNPAMAEEPVKEGRLSGWQPVHFAAANDRVESLELLQSVRASMVSLTQDGFSPLHLAIYFGAKRACRFLLPFSFLSSKIEGNSFYFKGFEAVHLGAFTDHLPMIIDDLSHEMLSRPVEGGAFDAFTPLMIAQRRRARRSRKLIRARSFMPH